MINLMRNLASFILMNLLLNMKHGHIVIIIYYNLLQDHLFSTIQVLVFNHLMRRNSNLNLVQKLL